MKKDAQRYQTPVVLWDRPLDLRSILCQSPQGDLDDLVVGEDGGDDWF